MNVGDNEYSAVNIANGEEYKEIVHDAVKSHYLKPRQEELICKIVKLFHDESLPISEARLILAETKNALGHIAKV